MKIDLKNIRKSFVHVFGGSVLTESFLIKNIAFIIMIVVIMIFFISHRYTVLQKISEIEKLKTELKDAKYESITISSNLTEASRQSQIEKMIEDAGMELKIAAEPAYKIPKK